MAVVSSIVKPALSRAGWQYDIRRMGWTNGPMFVSEDDLHRMDLRFGPGGPKSFPELRDMMLKITGVDLTALPPPAPPPPAAAPFEYPDAHRLKVRLNIPPTQSFPWSDVFIVRGVNYVNVVLSFERGDRLVVLQDDAVLFPSDTLIAKMQLLRE